MTERITPEVKTLLLIAGEMQLRDLLSSHYTRVMPIVLDSTVVPDDAIVLTPNELMVYELKEEIVMQDEFRHCKFPGCNRSATGKSEFCGPNHYQLFHIQRKGRR